MGTFELALLLAAVFAFAALLVTVLIFGILELFERWREHRRRR